MKPDIQELTKLLHLTLACQIPRLALSNLIARKLQILSSHGNGKDKKRPVRLCKICFIPYMASSCRPKLFSSAFLGFSVNTYNCSNHVFEASNYRKSNSIY